MPAPSVRGKAARGDCGSRQLPLAFLRRPTEAKTLVGSRRRVCPVQIPARCKPPGGACLAVDLGALLPDPSPLIGDAQARTKKDPRSGKATPPTPSPYRAQDRMFAIRR